MSTNYANPASLTELSTLVERTLLDTGRLFRKSGSLPATAHLQRSIPANYESFQCALDSLSEQIFVAKAFLEKDYEAIKAREAAPQSTDVDMKDVDQKVVSATQPPASEPLPSGAEPVKVEVKTEDGAGVDLTTPSKDMPGPPLDEGKPVGEEKETTNKTSTDQIFNGATEGLNFDSVLKETGGPNDLNLGLDFGDDDMGNQAFLSGSAFGTTNTASEVAKPETSQPPESSTVAPAGGDDFDLELQKTQDNPLLNQGNEMDDDIMAPAESSFYDLFMEKEDLEGGTGDLNNLEGDSLMNINDLDDNWFQ